MKPHLAFSNGTYLDPRRTQPIMSDTTGPHGIRETVQLATIDGAGPVLMPRFGLGVYECDGQECYNSVLWALEAGYRLIE